MGGHAGVVIGKLVLIGGVLALLAPIGYRRERPFVSIAVLALLLILSCSRFMPRPELVSFVLLAALLRILDRFDRTGDAWVYAIIPLQLIWVNVHGLFALGIAICGMYFVGEIVRALTELSGAKRWNHVRRLGVAMSLGTLVCVANPNGIEGVLYPFQQLGMVSLSEARGFFGASNIELQPAFSGLALLPLVLFLGFAALGFVSGLLNRKNLQINDVLIFIAFGYLALGAIRNIPLFAIATAPILVRNWNEILDSHAPSKRHSLVAGAATALLLALLIVDAARGHFYPRISKVRTAGIGVDEISIPEGAVDWIERSRPRGPIAHHMREGGYIIWRLYPEYRVMLDGRLEIFGPEQFRSLMADRPERFEDLDAKFHFGVALVRYASPGWKELLGFLQRHPRWRLVFIDDVAALFVRLRPGESLAYPEVDLDASGHFPPVDGSDEARSIRRLKLRTFALLSLGRPDLALEAWEHAMSLFPDMESGESVRTRLRADAQALGRQR
jgi:hypothetical protein